MKVFMLKDVEKVGMSGELISVSDGYAQNYLLPRKLALHVTKESEALYAHRVKSIAQHKEVVSSKNSMLAERIGLLEIKIKRPMHNDGKLYGAISAQEVVDGLLLLGVSVAKNQVLFNKNIKERGAHKVTIKLSSKLQPTLTVNVIEE